MSAAHEQAHSEPTDLWEKREAFIKRFEAAWLAGQRPALDDYLPADPTDRRAVLVELVHADLECRLGAGEKVPVETYFQRYPELAADPEVRRELTAAANELRREAAGQVRTNVGNVSQRRPADAEMGEAETVLPPASADIDAFATRETPAAPAIISWAAREGAPHIPGYELLGELDPGGMGVVYRARHVRLGIPVALKMVRTGQAADPQELARFHVEAQAVAALHHPNVVRIYDYGECQGLPYFSMEFVSGGSLARKLQDGPMPGYEAARLVETLARAMHAVHKRGIVHRDLKPANVLLGEDGTPKIADFGLAKRPNYGPELTATVAVMGTASYMAPEQAKGRSKEAGPAADVYGLGAVLYECLTGRPPFWAETRELTILKVLTEDPEPPSQVCPEVPRDLNAVCLKCLEKSPDHRYRSAEHLGEELGRYLAGESVAAAAGDQQEWLARSWRRAGYEILGEAGRAGMGVIYKTRQLSLNRVVALKIIGGSSSGADRASFLRNAARAVASLQHPNIVQVYDYGELNGCPYYTMEFLEGESLDGRLKDEPLPAREAAELVEKLARGIHHAHARGILHRDLKPAHILFTPDGTPKITGFGLFKRLHQDADENAEGAIVGTPSYMAPEQACGEAAKFGPATDVYGLGAVLYEMLTGRPPFRAATIWDTIREAISQDPEPPSRLRPEVPGKLEAICLKCLRKEAGHRYASAEELAEDLRKFLASGWPRHDGGRRARIGRLFVPGYEILGELGQGGMGIVYKARQIRLDRLVALKMVLAGALAGERELDRFRSEAETMTRLEHPNIVRVYEVGEQDGLPFLAMEFVDGGSLVQKINGEPLPVREAARLVETVARAVHHAYKSGIVHGDLKPANLLLTSAGVPKIADFGMARRLDGGTNLPDMEGEIVGTPSYLSPEQVSGDSAPGPRTDVFALGSILYELLTGRPPFLAATPLDTIVQVLTAEPMPPSRLNAHVPRDLETVCLKCLRRKPEERYADAGGLAEGLCRFSAGRRSSFSLRGVWGRIVNWAGRRPKPEENR